MLGPDLSVAVEHLVCFVTGLDFAQSLFDIVGAKKLSGEKTSRETSYQKLGLVLALWWRGSLFMTLADAELGTEGVVLKRPRELCRVSLAHVSVSPKRSRQTDLAVFWSPARTSLAPIWPPGGPALCLVGKSLT